tara:strand:- start:9193 stop:10071 length:879 start_codon:yes stop_codon:yes gene_type:complete
MNNQIECLGIAVNPILQDQIKCFLKSSSIHFSNKKDFKKSINVLLYALKVKSNYILVYNSSALNILLVLILWFRRKKIIFQLHDPIPHSGVINPLVFIVNFVIVLFANDITVFSEKLKKQVKKYYLSKNCHVVSHGSVIFNYNKNELDDKRIVVGFFGRNMPYKNYQKFINFIKSRPDVYFITVGQGYPKINFSNHKLFSGVIERDLYFSLMVDVDYVFFSHKKISYSGVLNDIISLKKIVLVDEQITPKIDYKMKHNFKNKKLVKHPHDLDFSQEGWNKYYYEIEEIIKNK